MRVIVILCLGFSVAGCSHRCEHLRDRLVQRASSNKHSLEVISQIGARHISCEDLREQDPKSYRGGLSAKQRGQLREAFDSIGADYAFSLPGRPIIVRFRDVPSCTNEGRYGRLVLVYFRPNVPVGVFEQEGFQYDDFVSAGAPNWFVALECLSDND